MRVSPEGEWRVMRNNESYWSGLNMKTTYSQANTCVVQFEQLFWFLTWLAHYINWQETKRINYTCIRYSVWHKMTFVNVHIPRRFISIISIISVFAWDISLQATSSLSFLSSSLFSREMSFSQSAEKQWGIFFFNVLCTYTPVPHFYIEHANQLFQ